MEGKEIGPDKEEIVLTVLFAYNGREFNAFIKKSSGAIQGNMYRLFIPEICNIWNASFISAYDKLLFYINREANHDEKLPRL